MSSYDEIDKKIVKSYELLKKYIKNNNKNYHFQESVSAFNLHDIKTMAAIANLKIVNTFGDYNLNSFEEKTSDRLILVMRVNK